MNICYVETSHDQEEKILFLSKACDTYNCTLHLIVTSESLKKVYARYVDNIYIIKPNANDFCYSSIKGYWMERKSRFWGCYVKHYSKKDAEAILNDINPDIVLSFVGPEAIKYIILKLAPSKGFKFYFLDQVQNGYKTVCELPYSVGGDIFGSEGNLDEHVPFYMRKPKKILEPTKLFKFSRVRFLEAVVSTANRKIKKYVVKHVFHWVKPKNRNEVILAPQGFTEAAYTYGTVNFDTPVKQLFNYAKSHPNKAFRWRLHPVWYTRIAWNDIITIVKSKFPVEYPGLPLSDSLKSSVNVVSINSNIIFDANILGTSSLALGQSVFQRGNLRGKPLLLSEEAIKSFNNSVGLGYRHWNEKCFNHMIETLINY
jgi:hypothetical protein